MLEDILKDWEACEVSAFDVYSDIFQLGNNMIQHCNNEKNNFQSNPLAYWKTKNNKRGHYRILFDDTFEETLEELQRADFAILNGITYFGRKNLQQNANKMFAMIFDLDGVTDNNLINFLSGAYRADVYPIPNYIALSGNGIHLYYVFEAPILLYPNIKMQLKNLKYDLTEKIWNNYTSKLETKQFQGINQGFRVIGGKTKIDGINVRAFRLNTHKFTLKEICKYIPEESRIDENKLWKESKMTLEEAKKKYPEWYERRILGNDTKKGYWTCKRDLYDWWKRKIEQGATFHHRYFAIMCLAIYAVKSGISESEVTNDAFSYIQFMNDIAPTEPFTESDVISALECYDERYCTFPINDIIKLSGIKFEKNKRNGRKQSTHIKRITLLRDSDYPNGEWRNKDGRPNMKHIVSEWRAANPTGCKADCIRETGLSKPTVYKHWSA